MARNALEIYGAVLERVLVGSQATDLSGATVATDRALEQLRRWIGSLDGGRMFFVGNGGSAATASHLAIDYQKNGGIPAFCLSDGAALTCFGNDLGFDHVYAAPLKAHARPGDLLVAISSSGRSADILNGVQAARERGAKVITFSGFTPDNPLRGMGELNFYVASRLYGYVEIAHLAICHAVLDLHMGLAIDEKVGADRA